MFTCDLVHLAKMAQTCLSITLCANVLGTGIGALWRLVDVRVRCCPRSSEQSLHQELP